MKSYSVQIEEHKQIVITARVFQNHVSFENFFKIAVHASYRQMFVKFHKNDMVCNKKHKMLP